VAAARAEKDVCCAERGLDSAAGGIALKWRAADGRWKDPEAVVTPEKHRIPSQ